MIFFFFSFVYGCLLTGPSQKRPPTSVSMIFCFLMGPFYTLYASMISSLCIFVQCNLGEPKRWSHINLGVLTT